MSQEGALGYALHGVGYREILAHYYSGTEIGQAPARDAGAGAGRARRSSGSPWRRYVRGVVSAEVPSDWPLAALEAQAVASRTYALTDHAGGSSFDVYADTRSQVYRGVAAETPRTNAAVAATAGQIVVYNGSPAITYFFASSGGMTENVENGFPGALPEPWLHGVARSLRSGTAASMGAQHQLRLGRCAPARPGPGSLPGHRGAASGAPRRASSPPMCSGRRDARSSAAPNWRPGWGCMSTWAYFSVSNGKSVTPEPDRSGSVTGEPAEHDLALDPRRPAGWREGAGRLRTDSDRRRRAPIVGPADRYPSASAPAQGPEVSRNRPGWPTCWV